MGKIKNWWLLALCVILLIGSAFPAFTEEADIDEAIIVEAEEADVYSEAVEPFVEEEEISLGSAAEDEEYAAGEAPPSEEDVLLDTQTDMSADEPQEVLASSGDIPIDEAHFPDANFRAYVLKECDKDQDGYLSSKEISSVKDIDANDSNITSLTGIEYFTNLEDLNCIENQLRELDVSQNTLLANLDCSDNQISKLIIGNNRHLETLLCWNNQLSELDIKGCPALDFLHCKGNSLDRLDFSGNPSLVKFVKEYGPCFAYGEIVYLHPNDWGQSDESVLSHDRRVRIYADGALLYSPDKFIERKLRPLTIGVGESTCIMNDILEENANMPVWVSYILSNGGNTYTSSNAKIVKTKDKSDTVKGIRTGKATVTVVSPLGVRITRKVIVRKAPKWVKLSKSKVKIETGNQVSLKAKLPSGSASCRLTWKSSNKSVAVYDEDHGVVEAYKPGTATITVRTHNGKTAKCKVTVTAPGPKTMDLLTDQLNIHLKETFRLEPLIDEGTSTTFSYKSKNKRIASVSKDGVITGKGEGKTQITVKTENGLKKTVTVVVAGKMKMPTKYITGTSGVQVYTTNAGKYYHANSSCSGLTDASKVSLETALNYGKTACPTCLPNAQKTVYALKGGSYYHYKKAHCGSKAKSYRVDVTLACGMKPCPICIQE